MDETRLEHLLSQWEAARLRGDELTLSALCEGDTELEEVLKERVGALKAADALLRDGASAESSELSGTETTAWLQMQLEPTSDVNCHGRLGKYLVRRILGHGGMGVVLQVTDSSLGRDVAIKVIQPSISASHSARERFMREARALASVDHPRVVAIHHVGQWNEMPFLEMPLLKGCSLAQRLVNGTPIPLREAVVFVREAAEGLAAAHEKDLIHRDIKPSNLWLEDAVDGTHVRLIDFGIARSDADDKVTLTGTPVGTPRYMSPEQAEGGRVDFRTDLFSLGCVLYELLTSCRPFSGNTTLSILRSITSDRPRDPKEIVPEIPQALSKLALSMLEKNPADRPGSASQVAEQLRQIESQLAAQKGVDDIRSNERDRSYAFKWPSKATTIGLASLLVACMAIPASLWFAGSKDPAKSAQSKRERSSSATSDERSSSQERREEEPVPDITVFPDSVVEVDDIEITLWRRSEGGVGGSAELLGLNARNGPAMVGDGIQFRARLSVPAFGYLVICRPDGVIELCYPESESQVPTKTDTLSYPIEDATIAYGLEEGTGLWCIAAIVSDRPLPSYRDWMTQHGTVQWKHVPVESSDTLWWRGRGQHVIPINVRNGQRGKGTTVEGPAAAIVRLTDAFEVESHLNTAAIGFPVVKTP